MRRIGAALACALWLAAAACGPSGGESPRAKESKAAVDESLDVLIPSLVDAIQAKQPKFVMDHVAAAFKEDGGLDYYDVRALVEKFALVDDVVGARLESVTVTPGSDGRQRVTARVAFALGQRLATGDSLPENGVVYGLEIEFAKSEGRWQAVGGRYKREVPAATSPPVASTETR